MRTSWTLPALALLAAIVSLPACSRSGEKDTSASSAPPRASLSETLEEVQSQAPLERRFDPLVRIQFTSDPVSLDPSLAEDGLSLRILNNLMEGLVRLGDDGTLEPGIASGWDFKEGGKRIEFELRKDAVWSDGKPVRAADFVTGFRRSLSPENSGKLSAFLLPIRNAEEVLAGKQPSAKLGVEAKKAKDGSEVFVVHLKQAAPWLLQALSLPVAFPQRDDILRGSGGKWTERSPVTGEYRIVDRRLDRSIRLEPNPEYRGAGSGSRLGLGASKDERLPIVIQIIQDEATAMNLFQAGDLDILTRVPLTELSSLRSAGLLRSDPFRATFFIGFNVKKPPFDRKELRRAVSAAIRRDEIASLLGGGEEPAWSWIPPELEGARSENDAREALESDARRGMAAARKELNGKEVTLAIDSGSRNALLAEKIQADLKKTLGLKVTIETSDWRTHIHQMATDAAPMFRFGWLAPFADPITHLQSFTSSDPNNYGRFRSTTYDQLVERISGLAPGRSRAELVEKADQMLTDEEAVLAPVYFYSQNHAVSARITGFRVNPFGTLRFSALRVKPQPESN